MAGRYGMSFAAKMIEQGRYAEAIEEATRAVARDEEDPTPLVERASAYAWLERYPEAVTDLEAAIKLDEAAGVLEVDVVDDAYFSALLGAAKAEAPHSMEAADRTLARYRTVLPGGRHLADAEAWPERLRTMGASPSRRSPRSTAAFHGPSGCASRGARPC
jgi:tetratricopeptide (TPR) repeat protein